MAATTPFGKAFAEARKSGAKTFEFNGKKYTTQMKGEGASKPASQAKPADMTGFRRDSETARKDVGTAASLASTKKAADSASDQRAKAAKLASEGMARKKAMDAQAASKISRSTDPKPAAQTASIGNSSFRTGPARVSLDEAMSKASKNAAKASVKLAKGGVVKKPKAKPSMKAGAGAYSCGGMVKKKK